MAVKGNQIKQLVPRTEPVPQAEVASGFAQPHISRARCGEVYLLFQSLGSLCCVQTGVQARQC